ncbi:virulence RhuM family protein [Sulfuritalea sp.]|uniref:virulence RhuM family protein n=1 Tax=Sulfuritalea sp. TaxID=2480090 RepID=UPI001AC98AEC|nr:virulence RhuM family protein [Sulfuritalea sp.]MBN8476705.1 virulence RhuM family protein [Sulfuritalea sp.]
MKKPPKGQPQNYLVEPAEMVSTEFLLYQTEDGQTRIEVRMVGETVWLNLNRMSELFGRDKSVISRHIRNVYEEGELSREGTVANFATVQSEGERSVERDIEHYSLDVIISVGYRVKSLRGTQFRIWATQRLREYLIKGFAMDDERLKVGGGGRYFDELLARIRDIRSSEKVFWRKVLEIYATSIDYDPVAETSQQFFATVQNKMHWAAHGHTAAEIINQRADAAQPNMGLTAWQGIKPRKADAEIAKNYLAVDELDTLNRIVTFYLEFAELQAMNRRAMTMADWIRKLDDFLRLSEREILTHAGKVSSDAALKKAHIEYEKYRQSIIELPSLVEQHFEEAVDKTKRLAKAKKVGTP